MRRGPEAREAQGLPVFQLGESERTEPDRPRAEQGCGFHVGKGVRDRVHERLGHGHQLGVAAVGIAARGLEVLAQVLLAVATELAPLARRINPGHAHAVAALECVGPVAQGFHPPDDLMAQDDRQPGRRHPPFDLVEFGVADPADAHPNQNFARGRRRVGPVCRDERAEFSLTGATLCNSMART